jgi:hypothetical protein
VGLVVARLALPVRHRVADVLVVVVARNLLEVQRVRVAPVTVLLAPRSQVGLVVVTTARPDLVVDNTMEPVAHQVVPAAVPHLISLEIPALLVVVAVVATLVVAVVALVAQIALVVLAVVVDQAIQRVHVKLHVTLQVQVRRPGIVLTQSVAPLVMVALVAQPQVQVQPEIPGSCSFRPLHQSPQLPLSFNKLPYSHNLRSPSTQSCSIQIQMFIQLNGYSMVSITRLVPTGDSVTVR